MNRFDIVFFDAGNTLIYPSPSFEEGIQAFLIEAGYDIPLDTVREVAYAELKLAIKEITRGRRYCTSDEEDALFWQNMYARMLRRLSFDGNALELGLCIYRFWQRGGSFEMFDDVRPALDALSNAGMRIGIISNFGSHLETLLAHHGILDRFEPRIISAQVGSQKPEPGIFRTAIERAGVDPGRAAIVGDNPIDDMEGAYGVGMVPVIIDRPDRLGESITCHRITDLRDLADYILH